MSVIYAIGDIHGRRDLLDILIDHIRDYHGLVHAGPAELMFLGDYVDHGPDSNGVIGRHQRYNRLPERWRDYWYRFSAIRKRQRPRRI
mgnify:CR=1 FL=1